MLLIFFKKSYLNILNNSFVLKYWGISSILRLIVKSVQDKIHSQFSCKLLIMSQKYSRR